MMISRRNFAMLTMIMLVMLFMFQSTGIAKNRMNDAQTNEYAQANRTEQTESGSFSVGVKAVEILRSGDDAAAEEEAYVRSRLVLFIGDKEMSRVFNTVQEWCTYSKRGLLTFPDVSSCGPYIDKAQAILVDSASLDLSTDVDVIQSYVDGGHSVVFCNLPDVEEIKSHKDFQELLGITTVYENETHLTGAQLFDGFLLGGTRIYKPVRPEEEVQQDLDLDVPWYMTLAGDKTYMIGLKDELKSQEGDMDNERAPGLIWRQSAPGGGFVFAVNGDFIEESAGIGILQAMMFDLSDYDIYPVVNAQNFSVVNYPSFAEENSEVIQERYSRELPSLYRDVVWQGITSVTERSKSSTTALVTPQYDYSDENEPLADSFTYYARLLREKHMEIGLALQPDPRIALREKIERDLSFLNENLEGYVYRSVYVPKPGPGTASLLQSEPGLSEVTTVLADYDPDEHLLYYDEDYCVQRATNDAFSHTYSEDLRMQSLESALGYTSVILNMRRVAYPNDEDDNWEKLHERFSSYFLTYWKNYDDFAKTTLSESDVRVRRFLNLDYSYSRSGDEIAVDIDGFEHEAYFILRTHGEKIAGAEGATYQKLEKDAYLITANEEKIVIRVENEQKLSYY